MSLLAVRTSSVVDYLEHDPGRQLVRYLQQTRVLIVGVLPSGSVGCQGPAQPDQGMRRPAFVRDSEPNPGANHPGQRRSDPN